MDDSTLNIIAMMFITAFSPALTEQLKIFKVLDSMAILINILLAVLLFLALWALNGSAADELGRYFGFAAAAAGMSIAGHSTVRNGQRKRWAQNGLAERHIGGKA